MGATSTRLSLGSFLVSVLVLVVVSVLSQPALGSREGVGGKTDVPGVDHDTQVQELGRYCVEEYNREEQRRYRYGRTGLGSLSFNRVVEAEKQVDESEIKYFLKIEATLWDLTRRMFNSVVVVNPRLNSRELLHFSPVDPML